MSEFFLKILNMSISASWIVLVVLVLRLLLKKAPKWINVLLWGIVAVRLVCPFSLESALSLIPSAETVSPQIMLDRTPQIDSGVPIINEVVNPIISGSFTPQPIASANPLQILVPVAANLWILGVLVLFAYTAISYWSIRRKVRTAVLWQGNIFQSENVASPFVLGIIRPKIYLPFAMSEQEMAHVIAHEKAHIRRKDHWWKPLGFLVLTLYWFNPLLWLGYVLLCRDIELACDEKVVKDFTREQKADYSQALLRCSVNHRMISACPLAFGEVGVKRRVRSVLNYKKPAFWIIVAAVLVSVAVAVCFLTNPKTTINEELSVFLDTQIAEHFYSPEHTDDNFITVHHKVLGVEESLNTTTVYTWVLYREYSCENGQIQEKTGSHIPTVITAKRTGSHGHYELVEYWEPRDGSYNVPDIKGKFPWYLHDKALDSQRYIKEQSAWCNQSAEEYFSNIPDGEETASNTWSPIIDAATFDIDNDGKNEKCILGYGPTSGLFTITLLVWEEGKLDSTEYFEIYTIDPGSISFVEVGREVKLRHVSQNDSSKTIDYSFCVQDGEVGLTANGEDVLFWQDEGLKPNLYYTEVYEKTTAEQVQETIDKEDLVISQKYYKAGELWIAGGYTYKYRLEITGRMHNAAKNTTYIVLSNTEDITFDMAWKAAGYSSNSEDYFDPEVAMIVGSRLFA